MKGTEYEKEDFATPQPYEEILEIRNPFERTLAIDQMAEYAKTLGVNGFKRYLKQYSESKEKEERTVYIDNVTCFTGQPIELDSGEWRADDWGVSRKSGFGEEVACPHPIMPVERLVNIDTGVEKLKLKFCKRDRRWKEVIVDKSTLASNQKILALSDMGISVTSENARAMVKYISDMENINYDLIPERKSVARLGYIEGEGFSPYVEGLIFDGDANFRAIFESIQSAGSQKEWMNLARTIRRGNVMARIVLAASFASVLVGPVGGLPFFVHLWGGESGTGKTVALMLAASVWGNPEMGRYIQTFNSTVIGRERLASFLNHLPFLIDELQLAKDARGKLMFDVYALAEGVGKTRSNRTLGIDRTSTWANCVITTGETPITVAGAGAGAINRVIEIECKAAQKIIEDGHGVSGTLRKNYGFAGKEFVETLYASDNVEAAERLYKLFFKSFSDNDTTEKQAMAAAAIITADALATDWIFRDGCALSVEDISKFLASKAAVSAGMRGYEYMCQWVTQNANKFTDSEQGEVYGVIDDGGVIGKKTAYIISSVFRRAVEEAGFSPAALLSYLKEQGLILTRGKNMTRGKRIRKMVTECVTLLINDIDEEREDILPFGPGEVTCEPVQQKF